MDKPDIRSVRIHVIPGFVVGDPSVSSISDLILVSSSLGVFATQSQSSHLSKTRNGGRSSWHKSDRRPSCCRSGRLQQHSSSCSCSYESHIVRINLNSDLLPHPPNSMHKIVQKGQSCDMAASSNICRFAPFHRYYGGTLEELCSRPFFGSLWRSYPDM